MAPLKIGIVITTIREGRFGDIPAAWIKDHIDSRDHLDAEVVDLRDYRMPLYGDLEEADPLDPHGDAVRRWARKMNEFDGYIFMTAEYNHSITGALKNSLDYLGQQLHRKPATFVGYGGLGAARAVEHLRQILVELQMAPLRNAVHIGMEQYIEVLDNGRTLNEFDFLMERAGAMLDELGWWSSALRAARIPAEVEERTPEGSVA